jgi:hypothetical protein
MKSWRDKEEFKTRVQEWAAKLGVKTHYLAVRPMHNKWASCSTAGNLNFNSELLEFEREIGDYVIVHELLHSRGSRTPGKRASVLECGGKRSATPLWILWTWHG